LIDGVGALIRVARGVLFEVSGQAHVMSPPDDGLQCDPGWECE
jgi:hypothetical protein